MIAPKTPMPLKKLSSQIYKAICNFLESRSIADGTSLREDIFLLTGELEFQKQLFLTIIPDTRCPRHSKKKWKNGSYRRKKNK